MERRWGGGGGWEFESGVGREWELYARKSEVIVFADPPLKWDTCRGGVCI